MWTVTFWKAIVERALKTFVEAWAAALAAGAVGIHDADWVGSLSVAGFATLLSVLVNIGVGLGSDGGPSVGNVEKLSPK